MKPITLLSAATLSSWLCGSGISHAQLTINYDFTPGLLVPDEGQISQVKTLGGLSGLTSFSNVTSRLTLTDTGGVNGPMYLGDLYSSLTFGNSSESQRIAVLLNRPGRDDSDEFGSGLSSLNVTLDDSTAGTNVWAATSATGIYNSDGRLGSNPAEAAGAFIAGSNGLAALNGSQLASNQVSLVVADFSGGGSATLAAWGVSVTGTAAMSGTFTPGADAWISDTGTGATNTVGATLNTTGSASGGLVLDIDGSTTFTAGVAGSGGLYKTGSGIVTLFAGTTNSYSGPTTVDSGVLVIDGTVTTSDVTVSDGGILSGTGLIGGDLTVADGGTHAAGNSPGLQTIGGNVTYESGSFFAWELGSETTSGPGANFDAVSVGGELTVNGAIFKIIVTGLDLDSSFWSADRTWQIFDTTATGTLFTSFDLYDSASLGSPIDYSSYGSFTFNAGTGGLEWSAVPEPSSIMAGFLIVTGLLRRRRA